MRIWLLVKRALFASGFRWCTPLAFVFLAGSASAVNREAWILVETSAQTLFVMTGSEDQPGKILARFEEISLGRHGVSRDHVLGDGTTPLGTFHVAWINHDSRFEIFFGLDFPTIERADRAFESQLIDRTVYGNILDALLEHHIPPQDTPLGGAIGIHGLGKGDPGIHQYFNWTDGCIALTNRQIAELARWVRIGTKVVVR